MWKIIYFIMKMLPGHYAKMAMWVAMEKLEIVPLSSFHCSKATWIYCNNGNAKGIG